MSQDVVADALNQIMNANRIEKKEVKIVRYSKVLIGVLEMMKKEDLIDFEINEDEGFVNIKLLKVNECRAIKPRFNVGVEDIEKYLRRYLPSINFGTLVITTSKGLLNHKDAEKENVGGSLIAYFY